MNQSNVKQPENPVARQLVGHLVHTGVKQPGAILLKGDWGVGKTYFWQTQVVPYLGEHRYAYVSLFGVNSISDLKTRLISGLIVDESLDTNAVTKLLNIGANFLSNLPKLAGSGAKALAKRYLDEEVVAALEVVDLKFDSLQLLPSNLIVCFDDVERMALAGDEFLGFVNTLMDQKQSRILLIANEDKLSEKYREFKEKVVWLTLKWNAPTQDVFEKFVEDTASGDRQAKIKGHKKLIMDCFQKSNHVNLRTLQRAIRLLDQVEAVVSLSEEHVRFLVALVIDDAICGGLHEDATIYNGSKHYYATFGEKKKPEELTGDAKVSHEFYSRFFEPDFTKGFSVVLHDFVRNGFLDESALKAELFPPDTRDEITKLAQEVQAGGWMFASDQDVSQLIEKVVAAIKGNDQIHIGVVLKLRVALGRLCRHMEVAVPDTTEAIDRRILERARIPDQLDVADRFADQKDIDDLKPSYDKYQAELRREAARRIKKMALEPLRAGREAELSTTEVRYSEELFTVLNDPEVLDAADAQLTASPEAHFRFYQYAIKRAQERPCEAATQLLAAIRARLAAAKAGTREKGVHRRVEWLLNNLPPETSA